MYIKIFLLLYKKSKTETNNNKNANKTKTNNKSFKKLLKQIPNTLKIKNLDR